MIMKCLVKEVKFCSSSAAVFLIMKVVLCLGETLDRMKVKYFILPVRNPGSARVAHKLLLGWYLLFIFQSNSTGSCTNISTQGV